MPVAPFATIADMQALFDQEELIQLSNPSGTTIDNARMDAVLGRASKLVLSKIANKYDVEAGLVQTALDLLRDYTCDIARYYLYRETAPEGVEKRFKQAVGWLDQIAAGTAKLDTGSQQVAARPEGVLVSVPERKFGRDAMKNF